MTTIEVHQDAIYKAEKVLQNEIYDYLSVLPGVYFEWDRMDKRHTGAKGRPDFRVCYCGRFIALEAKLPHGIVSAEQRKTLEKVKECGGEAHVVFSLFDVVTILRKVKESNK